VHFGQHVAMFFFKEDEIMVRNRGYKNSRKSIKRVGVTLCNILYIIMPFMS